MANTPKAITVKVDVKPTTPLQRKFTYAWGAWALMFFAFEGWAIFNKTSGDTLSEHTRHYFRVKGPVGTAVFLGMFGTFAAWFSAHIIQRKV